MSLDRWIQQERADLAANRLIEPVSDDCLTFADIERAAAASGSMDAASADVAPHLAGCRRCASLVERMRRGLGEARGDVVRTGAGPVAPMVREYGRARRVVRAAGWMAALAAVALIVVYVRLPEPVSAPDIAVAPTLVSLGTIFEEGIADGFLEDLLTRTFDEAQPMLGATVELDGGVRRYLATIRGPRLHGFCNADPTVDFVCGDTDCNGRTGGEGSPCEDPAARASCRESRVTVEIYLPPALDEMLDASAPAQLVVMQLEDPDASAGSGCARKRELIESMARAGTPGVLWYEKDLLPYPADGEPVDRLCEQFGFASDAELQLAGYRWMMLREPDALDAGDLRLDLRFAHAQSFILATTFFHAFLGERVFGEDTPVDGWLARMGVCIAGDSMERCDTGASGEGGVDGGALTAAGIDPRVVAVLVGGASLADGPGSSFNRYESDWSLCPGGAMDCGANSDPWSVDPWKDFSAWAWRNRDHEVSYFDAYHPARNRDRYEDKLILDVVATHEWRRPLGSSIADRGVMERSTLGEGGAGSPWNVRHVSRINRDRGVAYPVGEIDGREITASELLLRRTVAHLAQGAPLPEVELEAFDASDRRRWRTTLRIAGVGADHDPTAHERVTVYLAMSDDRDFRRCGEPILCSAAGEPCGDVLACLEPDWDDNKDAEDHFIAVPIEAASIAVGGDYREIAFTPPVELGVFDGAPLIAVIIEVRFDGGTETPLDDVVLHTPVAFVNDELYPVFECPQ